VRPQGFDKGRALALLIDRLGPFDLMLAAGDDRTDEDMFQQLGPGAWTIKVGRGLTHAHYYLDTPAQLIATLRRFLPG